MDNVLDNLFGKKENEITEETTEKAEEIKTENGETETTTNSEQEVGEIDNNSEVTSDDEITVDVEEIEPVEILDLASEIRAELDNFNTLDFEGVTFKNKIVEILNRHDV